MACQEHVKNNPDYLLHIPEARRFLVEGRLNRLKADDFRVLEGQSDNVRNGAFEKNLSNLKEAVALERPALLINPLMSIDFIAKHVKSLKVLSIGPRTEAELLTLIANGFNPKNIRGVDLVSYSDYVDLGDMHALPYQDDSFDVIIAGWVLTYSADPQKVAREILRVARPGCYVAVGCQHVPPAEISAEDSSLTNRGYGRYETTQDILRLFNNNVRSVPFRHDIHPTLENDRSDVMVVFDVF